MRPQRLVAAVSLIALVAASWTTPSLGQSLPPDSVSIVIGPEYATSPGWRFLSGRGWRAIWTAPVRLPVMDPARFEGGLVRFEPDSTGLPDIVIGWTADRRAWRIRPVNRLPVEPDAPAEIQGTIVDAFLRDLVSTLHPSAPLAAAALYRAAGLEAVVPGLTVLPVRGLPQALEPLAGQAVWIERAAERDRLPMDGFGAVITTDSLLALTRRDPTVRVDTRRFLASRLTDLLLGDRSRGPGAWRWGRRDEGAGATIWVPIAVRQEEAFLRPDGLDASLFTLLMPGMVSFSANRPDVSSLTWLAYDLDRPLLVRLERPVWDSIASALSARLTDDAIRSAVAAIPPGHLAGSDSLLVAGLMARREHLPEVVNRYFAGINRFPDVELSEASDQVRLARSPTGDLDLVVATPGGQEIFRRQFRARETKEVRLHLLGAGDTVRLDHMDRHGI
ncbi:MAG: hypothetical protein H6R40_919, partial [Gemmatimonadetes bacterium]|nr:hypothetical protein [Gemmatimonadota bacterium]